jgi:hypothetical protein
VIGAIYVYSVALGINCYKIDGLDASICVIICERNSKAFPIFYERHRYQI